MEKAANTQASMMRLILGSFLIALLGMFHVNFLAQGNAIGIGFLIFFVLFFYLAKKKKNKELVRSFQFKVASILSFLLPVSSLIYTFVFAGMAMENAGSEAEQAGAAMGSLIGGGMVTVFAFLVGISLGIVFYLMGRK